MKILLKNSVRSLGQAGDIVTVKPGYARNYLLPKGFAVPAGQATENLVATYTARRAEEEARFIEEAREAAAAINDLEVVLHMKANASNHLYGSVNSGEIVTQLNNRHINIEKTMVQLEEPIKELGNFEVKIHLADGIDATLRLDVRDEHGEIPVLEGTLDYEGDDEEDGDDEAAPAETAEDGSTEAESAAEAETPAGDA